MELEHSHKPADIASRLSRGARPNYLRDWVFGGIDGAVTTFAIVAGVVGASLSPTIVIIMGLANLIADGISMAAGNFSATKTERDELAKTQSVEENHIRTNPEGEREEIRQIFAGKGFDGEALETVVSTITKNKRLWISTMIAEEHGLSETVRVPAISGLATFIAFVICGAVPLIPYVLLAPENAFVVAISMTIVVFFVIGSLKSKWSLQRWWASGLETVLIGCGAAGAAYLIGYALRGLAAA